MLGIHCAGVHLKQMLRNWGQADAPDLSTLIEAQIWKQQTEYLFSSGYISSIGVFGPYSFPYSYRSNLMYTLILWRLWKLSIKVKTLIHLSQENLLEAKQQYQRLYNRLSWVNQFASGLKVHMKTLKLFITWKKNKSFILLWIV